MRFRALSTALLLLFTVHASIAQPADAAEEGLSLSLTEAIRLGLENNLKIQVERYSPLISQEDREGAWGSYDPTFDAEFGYPRRYRRLVTGQGPTVSWRVTRFEVVR